MRAAAALALVAVAGATARAGSAPPPDGAEMAARVRAEFLDSWRAYERYAGGHDELKPLSHSARDWYAEPLLMTPVDALDTMVVMGLDDEARRTRDFIAGNLSFDRDISVKTFEVTIRLLGGLLSSYQMTGDERLLRLASDLGRRLLPAFDSPTGMPYRFVNLRTGRTSGARSNPAEIGTLLLEFGTLSRITGDPIYFTKAKNALTRLHRLRSKIGLVGAEIDVDTGKWMSSSSHVGGGIDSYYEYLLKGWRLFGDADCERMWRQAHRTLNERLAEETPTGLWYGEVDRTTGRRLSREFGALQAFLPAVLALGGDLDHARRLEDSCFRMWTLHGIEPETIDYGTMKILEDGYPLRPEIVESAYYLHHYTNDPKYLEMGRSIFEDLIRHCRTDAGYTVLKSAVTKEKGDLMPSYFLAETLKYLYLLFAPDKALDFDRIVFNTEAHPLTKDGPPRPPQRPATRDAPNRFASQASTSSGW